MAFSGDVEAVPKTAVSGHTGPAEACIGDGVGMVESRPVAAETTSDSDHLDAAASEQQAAERPTPEIKEKAKLLPPPTAMQEEGDGGQSQESTRERLKRHRQEMAGRVWVPDMWGQEKLLKYWVDCSAFDRPLVPAGLLTARRALVAESCARRPARTTPPASSSPLRVQNGFS